MLHIKYFNFLLQDSKYITLFSDNIIFVFKIHFRYELFVGIQFIFILLLLLIN